MELAIFGQAMREYLRPKRLVPWIALAVVCAVLAFAWLSLDPSSKPDGRYTSVSSILVFRLLALSSAIFTTAIVSQEVEQKTIVYLLTRPVPRWKLLVIRYGASVLVVSLVGIVAALLTSVGAYRGIGHNPFLAKDILALVIGAFAYGALFLFVSLLFNRALIICALFAFGWEASIPNMPGEMNRLSIFSYLQAIANHQNTDTLTGPATDSVITSGSAYMTLAILIVVMVAASMWWFTHFEYVPREDAE